MSHPSLPFTHSTTENTQPVLYYKDEEIGLYVKREVSANTNEVTAVKNEVAVVKNEVAAVSIDECSSVKEESKESIVPAVKEEDVVEDCPLVEVGPEDSTESEEEEEESNDDSKENIQPPASAPLSIKNSFKQRPKFVSCVVCKKRILESKTQSSVCNLCCTLCRRTFRSAQGLIEHQGGKYQCKAKFRSDSVICSICNKPSRQSQCTIQIKTSLLVCKLCCAICRNSFDSTEQLVFHYTSNCVKIK